MRSYLQAIVLIMLMIAFLACTMLEYHDYAGYSLVAIFVVIAMLLRKRTEFSGYSFTFIIFAAGAAAMYYPGYFVEVGGIRLSVAIVPLMQVIMFGMGASLSLSDFTRILKMPKGVLAGVMCHYLIMPFTAFSITRLFQFPDEVAAGVILVGSCPGGLASNVMTYLARANVALSVTVTAISTLTAPFFTPLFMSWLAGEYVPVEFSKMFFDIVKIVIIPVGAGLCFNYFVKGKWRWIDNFLPVLSMAGIAFIILIITAAGRSSLLVVGPALIIAVLIHNLSGYFFGYTAARLLGLVEEDRRTIAIEVGLQNAGLASGLALAMGKLATVGLASAIFAPVMNITGSTLASWWRNRSKQ